MSRVCLELVSAQAIYSALAQSRRALRSGGCRVQHSWFVDQTGVGVGRVQRQRDSGN